jgi:SAM-dependent methyltransferase
MNKRVNNFYFTLSNMLIDRVLDKTSLTKNTKILELAARSNILGEVLLSKGLDSNFFQTALSNQILLKNRKKIIADSKDVVFKNSIFDVCFCLFSLVNSNNIPLIFENVYNLLKSNGVFLTVIPSEECFKEFRYFFFNFYKPLKNLSFNPTLDIQTLGNIGSAAGFKNIIVDKEEFNLKINYPEELWNFIRDSGESNYMLKRNNFKIKKSLYKKFYNSYKKEIKTKKMQNNTLSIYFFFGIK